MSSTCKCCKQIKTKIAKKEGDSIKYVDENNTLWKGKYCPSCKKQYTAAYSKVNPRPSYYKKSTKPLIDKKCTICNAEFKTKNPRQFLCSKKCRRQVKNLKRRKNLPPKKVKEPKRIHPRDCLTCSKSFLPKRLRGTYCGKKCRPGDIKYHKKSNHTPAAKKLRKQRKLVQKFRQPISKKFKKEIIEVYASKPEGYEIDHIIPINHPDVCGLHVPWNLRILSKTENIKKSNKFDGTNENNSWAIP